MAGTITRGKAFRADFANWDGKTSTATRLDATGGTVTGLAVGNEVDVLQIYGAGSARTRATIADAVQQIGSAAATLVFAPGTWTIDDNLTIPSNFTCHIPAGCVFNITSGKTLTFSGPLQRESETWTSGSGSVAYTPSRNVILHTRDFWSQTVSGKIAAETTAGVTPTNYAYPPLNPLRYGAVGDSVTDDHVAVQAAFTVAGVAGGTVIFPPGYTFLCSADITIPVAAASGSPVASAQGPGWATVSVIFGSGATFGFVILGTGATTGDVQGSTYNYAGTFRDLGIQLNGTAKNAFYVNSVNQPHIYTCWIRGSGTNGCAAKFLNCLVPVFEDTLVTGCGSATQYSVEFDTCTTASWRGSRISGGVVTKGGLAIDRCTNFVIDGISSESCGTPIVISGKAEATLANTTITMRGLELENPGAGNPYIDIGAGLSGSALVLDVTLDGWYASPSGTVTVPYAVRMQNITGFEAKGSHFTLGSAPTSCFEIVGTTVSGIFIRTHRNLSSLGIPWVRYNGTQVLAAGPHVEWQLGLIQSGRPICVNKGVAGIYDGANLTGATPSILVSSTMGGYYSSKGVANAGATTVTSLSGGEPGMEIVLVAADGNTTLTNGNSGGAFRLTAGVNLLMVAGRPYKFFNEGANGAAGSCWCQMS